MTLDSIKNRLKAEIGEDTKNALAEIEKELRKESYLFSEFVVYKNKYNSLSTKSNKGIITDESSRIEESRIVSSIIDLIDKVKENDLVYFIDTHPTPNKKLVENEITETVINSNPPKTFSELFISLLWKGKYRKTITVFLAFVGILLLIWSNLPTSTQEKILDNVTIEKRESATYFEGIYVPANFEIIKRRSVVDFRAWRRVPRKNLEFDRYSPVIYHQELLIEKKVDKSDFFLKTHWTDGVTLDFSCISRDCKKYSPDVDKVNPSSGSVPYKKFQIEFDVSDIVKYQQFSIEYQAVYWNSFQKLAEESMAVIAVHPTKEIIYEIYFPEGIDINDFGFRYAKKDENKDYVKINDADFSFGNGHLKWIIKNPSPDIYYGVYWDMTAFENNFN